uniref:Uncharacterized protein n=1 Tax=Arundo donax TaxID=35708 RepID=A0A0A9AMT5_ARUDO
MLPFGRFNLHIASLRKA